METRSWTILNSLALPSLAPAGEAGQEIGRLEGDMDEMRELFSRSNLNETGQKIVRVEGDVDEWKGSWLASAACGRT
ncbi:hypothetical protein ARSEF4850_006680 [Beauveria asiatica]